MAALYDRLDKNQKEVYDKIVAFGKGKDFSPEDINIALQIAYVESEFGKLKDRQSKNAAKGLFQYKEIHWVDRQQTEESQVGKKVKDILSSWGYTKDDDGTVNIYWEKQDDQIAMFYAELKIYADQFKKGVPDPAYNKVCRNIACPTDPYSRKALYIEATHHSAKNIGEVLNGWKNKVQPNLMDNLNYLKKNAAKWDKKASLDDPETPTDKMAEAAEQDTVRTTVTRQPDDIYQKERAGGGIEAETVQRGGDSVRRSIPNSWMADAGNVYSDAPNEALQSALREARKQKMQDAVTFPEAKKSAASGGNDAVHFPDDPGSPMRLAMDALELTADDVHLTPTEADGGGKTSDTFHIRDNDTSDIIGSCVMTPGGCEMTAGDRKVVADRISGSDVHLETYARNDEGDFEFLGMSRIGANDGITVRRPFAA